MNRFYKAGYYLIKQKTIGFGADTGKATATCSACINLSVLDSWCFSWMQGKLSAADKALLGLSDDQIAEIHQWTNSRFPDGANVFPDLVTALEFKNRFFKDRKDLEIYCMSLPETDAALLLRDFAPGVNTQRFNFNNGHFALRENLQRKMQDNDTANSFVLGFDFIGVECDGSFHSFHCHDVTKDLKDRFNLTLNKNGLFNSIDTPQSIREYLNNPDTGLEPVPWYIARIKSVMD